ncbi:hypothetical protein GCM10010234_50490 [Streptomyces hawaiiensis]
MATPRKVTPPAASAPFTLPPAGLSAAASQETPAATQPRRVIHDLPEADSHAHSQQPESALPLLKALAELLPWVPPPGDAFDAGPPRNVKSLQRVYDEHLTRLGVRAGDVDS